MAFDLDDPEYEVSCLKREIDELRVSWAEMLRRLGNIEPKANRIYNLRWDGTSRVASLAGIPADCGARRNRLIDAKDSWVYLGLIPALLPSPNQKRGIHVAGDPVPMLAESTLSPRCEIRRVAVAGA